MAKLRGIASACVLLFATMFHAAPTYGQVLYSNGPLPSFEVATIKPLRNPPATLPPQGGSTVHLYFNTKMLIMYAYNLPEFSEDQILKSAGWTDDYYEIQGKIGDAEYAEMQKMPAAERQEQIQLMCQSLLKSRFNLKVHSEKREQTIYALEVAKAGPKLTAAQDGEPSRFGVTHNGQSYELKATGIDLDHLVLLLGREPEVGGRSTVNRTGLQGKYDITLRWTRTGSPASNAGVAEMDGSAPSYFTAIQEQLGLRLVSTKGQVDDIVVDHIEKPSSN